jgi:hypothetical protein
MEKLTHEENLVLSRMDIIGKKISKLENSCNISEEKLISIINSINKKTDNLIKEKNGLYYTDDRAGEIILHGFVDEMKNGK